MPRRLLPYRARYGSCRTARGAIPPRRGSRDFRGAGFRQSGIDVTTFGRAFKIELLLGQVDYDDVTPHEMRVEFQIDDNERVTLARDGALERHDPNGINCTPTCWQAVLTTDDRVL